MPKQSDLNDLISTPELPLAQVDAQDVLYTIPLREYLEAWGCRVLVNETSVSQPTYQIVVGDRSFVKEYFLKQHKDEKILVLLMNETQAGWLMGEPQTRIFLVDAKVPSKDKVHQILSSFFTSTKKFLDLRENKNIEIPQSKQISKSENTTESIESKPPEIKKAVTNQLASRDNDQKRITKIIDDIFGKEKTKKINKKNNKGRFLFGIFFILTFPFIWYLFNLTSAFILIWLNIKFIQTNNVQYVKTTSSLANTFLGGAEFSLKIGQIIFTIFEKEEKLRSQEMMLGIINKIILSEKGIAVMIEDGEKLSRSILSFSTGHQLTVETPATLLTKLKNELIFIETNLGLADANFQVILDKKSFPFNLPPFFTAGDKARKILGKVRENSLIANNLLTLYPELGGFKEKRKFLVLFQNSLELRPTGGFIGSIGIATFVDGKMLDLEIQDVYALDGQLRGHVAPPQALSTLLGQEHWYLRDSNWDPDFRFSAEKAMWFYEKEVGEKVDGVIAVNVPLVVSLLKVTGPLTLPDYNDRITADNFFGKSLFYTQADFFPGSTQKKDFLGSLTSALITELTQNKPNVNKQGLWEVFGLALLQHDIMFYFTNLAAQALVENFSWAGAVPSASICINNQSVVNCVNDYLYINEANLGVNKANYFVKREGEWQINLDTQTTKETVVLNYKNTSSGVDNDGGGNYVAYLRVKLPLNTKIESVVFDGAPVGIYQVGQSLPTSLPWGQISTNDKLTELSVALSVPAGEDRKLMLTYERVGLTSFTNGKTNFFAFLQKQPGATWTNFQVRIKHPVYWEVDPVLSPITGVHAIMPRYDLLAKDGELQYNLNLTSDNLFGLTFSQ